MVSINAAFKQQLNKFLTKKANQDLKRVSTPDLTVDGIRLFQQSLANYKKPNRTIKNIKKQIDHFFEQELAIDIVKDIDIVREYTSADKGSSYRKKDPQLNTKQLVELTKILFSKKNLKIFSELHPRKDGSIKHQITTFQNGILRKIIETKVRELRENIENILEGKPKEIKGDMAAIELLKRRILEERNIAIQRLTAMVETKNYKQLAHVIETGVAYEPHKVQKASKDPEVSEGKVTFRSKP